MQAAILSVKLKYLDEENKYRRKIANYYLKNINNEKLKVRNKNNSEEHVWHLFVIECNERDRLSEYLTSCGVQTLIHYPTPPHKQEAYKDLGITTPLPLTEEIHNKILSLPISPILSFEDVKFVVQKLNEFK